jgi:hypothetical protein
MKAHAAYTGVKQAMARQPAPAQPVPA